MKPTKEILAAAVEELDAIPYFPKTDGARIAIAAQLGKLVATTAQLRWLVDTAVNHMGAWGGVSQLRALFCVQYRPADGIEGARCTISGFTPEDCEDARNSQLALAAPRLKELAAPAGPEPISDAERAEWAALEQKIKDKARSDQAASRDMKVRPYRLPAYLKGLI